MFALISMIKLKSFKKTGPTEQSVKIHQVKMSCCLSLDTTSKQASEHIPKEELMQWVKYLIVVRLNLQTFYALA